MKPRLILRADGNERIGLGHVSRLVALAEIAGLDWHRVFVLREPSTAVEAFVAGAVDEIVALPGLRNALAEADWLASDFLLPSDVLALDGYEFDLAYQSRLRPAVGSMLYFDDLHAFAQLADAVLNPAGGVPASYYELRQPGARLLIGPEWAPMRAPFREAAAHPAASAASPEQVVLCLGGADPGNATRQLAVELLGIPGLAHLHVVVGAAYQHLPALQEWATAQPTERLTLHHQLPAPEFCRLLQACGAAVLSASTVSYEYASLGGGLLCIVPTADNQRGIYEYLLTAGLALPYTALANTLSAPDPGQIASRLRAAQRRVFDGQTPARLRHLLVSLGAQARLTLRPATWADSALLFTWANDPLVRQASYNSAAIEQAAHESWFRNKLADPDHLILLAEVDGRPAGTIRFALDPTSGVATLSYLLAAPARGVGLAAPLLVRGAAAATLHFGQRLFRLVGHVQHHNEASQRAFRRAGYRTVVDSTTPAASVSFDWQPAAGESRPPA